MPSAEDRFGPVERIGLTDEWIEWFDRALAEMLAEQLEPDENALRHWRPIGIQPEVPVEIVQYTERTHVTYDLVPLVRAAVREYSISHHPWGFTP